jgi:DNA topoisomerase VI subunit B
MNQVLVNRLVDFILQIDNRNLTRQELVSEFQRVLDAEIKERIEFTKQQTIRNCVKELQKLASQEDC